MKKSKRVEFIEEKVKGVYVNKVENWCVWVFLIVDLDYL